VLWVKPLSKKFSTSGATVAQLDVVPIDNAHYSAVCDLTNSESCKEAVAAIVDGLGAIDVLGA
jgi:NAD(P)-dependent dehydrogenase (short-subunit alcohol dehydrogenase family)